MEEHGINAADLTGAAAVVAVGTRGQSVDDETLIKVKELEVENQKMRTEFNIQRAKLKELFLQKESECKQCQAENRTLQLEMDQLHSRIISAEEDFKNQLEKESLKAQEEISSLQQLVQDTIEESAICKVELERLRKECQRFLLENKKLREIQQTQQESASLGPQVLNQVKKTLVRKLGGESSSSLTAAASSLYQDGEPTKKSCVNHANEDDELLRSIVSQLQEEMISLKEKLREADEKLQASNKINEIRLNTAASTNESAKSNKVEYSEPNYDKNESGSISVALPECATCHSYEIKVQDLLMHEKELEEKIFGLQKCVEEGNQNLSKEAALRKDLEDQWQNKRDAYKAEVKSLREQVQENEKQLLHLQQKFLETKENVIRQLHRLTDERENVNRHLENLQTDNDFLSGRYLATAEEMESQNINLPNTVEELQELVLQQRSDLIQARVGIQYEQQKCVTSMDEIKILREQLADINEERRTYQTKMQTEMKSLEDRLKEHILTQHNYESKKIELERKEAELNRINSGLRVEIIELQERNEKLNKTNADYKAKIMNLQTDLSTSEQVQKDFVTLSQRLQMALEKLRRADAEVRWQDDDDVENCTTCNTYFTVTVRKVHCRHCGSIFCEKCLSKSVPSGPCKRPARVCDICHTLLTPNTAPYFSHEPLQAT